MPKGLTDAFKWGTPQCREEEAGSDLAPAWERAEVARIEANVFKQRKRLADTERKLAAKFTKSAGEQRRIADNLIARQLVKLDDFKRAERKERDERIYSGCYCPVMVKGADGQLVVRPMRYHCRPAPACRPASTRNIPEQRAARQSQRLLEACLRPYACPGHGRRLPRARRPAQARGTGIGTRGESPGRDF